MKHETLISVSELNEKLGQPGLSIVDCRFDLKDPDWGLQDYQQGHIPGAVYADLDKNLAGPKTPQSGRHPLPEAGEFARTISAWGIQPEDQVVVYDTSGGSMAVRLWWLLRYFGYAHPVILNGSFAAWQNNHLPLEKGMTIRYSAPVPVFQPKTELLISTLELNARLGAPDLLLIDARAPERYRGEMEPIDPIAGHIPGAINRFHANNLTADGYWKTPQQIEEEFAPLLRSPQPREVVVYCGSGVTSCHHLASLAAVGLPIPRLYLGSWSEWIRDPERPIALGDS